MTTWQPLLDRLTQLKDTWPAPPWTWDSRFSTIASSFEAAQEPLVRASAMLAFPRGGTVASRDAAPPELRAIAERTGGLRAGQRLLGGDPITSPGLYGLWWPWGGNAKVTLRIGILDVTANAEPLPRLRDMFGVKT
ncbi:hypothetical protein BH11MYX3_BH11MYX3_46980 [soil metagenome]